jgi:tetratricopeptide (TPR) repeat protein
MKRILAGFLLLAGLSTLAYGYLMTRRERLYRNDILRGELAIGRGDTFTALAAFSDAIALKPDSMLGYLKRGGTRYQRGELDAAADDLAAASGHDPTATRALELRGDVDLARQLPDRAAVHYASCVRLDDRSPGVLYKLGLAQLLAGRLREAAGALTRAVALDNRLAEGHYLLGVSLRELQQPLDAQRALERAVALAPSSVVAREQLAAVYAAAGNRPALIRQLDALYETDPRARRQIALAAAYAQANQTTRAVRLLGNAVERFPDQADTYVALGRMWLDIARSASGEEPVALGKSIEALQHAASMEPTSEALGLLGEARIATGELPLAERTLEEAAERLPADRATFLHLADAAERLGHLGAARAALVDYYSLSGPGDKKALEAARRISDLSTRLGDARAAAEWAARGR